MKPPEHVLTRQVLTKLNVPNLAIQLVGTNCSSTLEDVDALLAWARTNDAKQIVLPTDIFHTRRLRWVIDGLGQDTGIELSIRPMVPGKYAATNRWQVEEGPIAFQK